MWHMPAFVVIAINNPSETEARITQSFKEEDWFVIKNGAWLVDYEGTTRQLADKLELRKPSEGMAKHTGIVFAISNYFGIAVPDTWEWLNARVTRREG